MIHIGTCRFFIADERSIQRRLPSCSFTAEAPPRKIFSVLRRSLLCLNWHILLQRPPNTRGTHTRSWRPLSRISPGSTQHSSYWQRRCNAPSIRASSRTRSRSLDSRKALAWQRNSWPEMQCVTVVSLHLRAGLLVRPGLNSTLSASSQAPPAFSARVIVIPTSPGSELRSQRPFSLGSAEL